MRGVLGAADVTVRGEYSGLWGASGVASGGSGDAAAATAAAAAAARLWKADAADDAAACAADEVAYAALLGAVGGSVGSSLATGATAALVTDRTGLYTALGRVMDGTMGRARHAGSTSPRCCWRPRPSRCLCACGLRSRRSVRWDAAPERCCARAWTRS